MHVRLDELAQELRTEFHNMVNLQEQLTETSNKDNLETIERIEQVQQHNQEQLGKLQLTIQGDFTKVWKTLDKTAWKETMYKMGEK